MTLLEIEGLKAYYFLPIGVVKAVDDVTISLESGEVLGLVGESGCGKSTLALSIMDIIPYPGKIVQGEILFEGEDLLKKSEKSMQDIRGKEISMVFQSAMNALNPVHKVGNQITEAILIHEDLTRNEALIRVEDLIKSVGIDISRADDYPHELSGGMKQRIMIAMALACNPKLLISDEPTTALDVIIQAQVLNLLKQLKKKLMLSMILITHDLSVISEMGDKCAVMYAGKILEYAEMRFILENPMHPYTVALIKAFPSIDMANKRIESIPGRPPNLINPPNGCRFHPRCNYSIKKCKKLIPELMRVDKNHYVACHLVS